MNDMAIVCFSALSLYFFIILNLIDLITKNSGRNNPIFRQTKLAYTNSNFRIILPNNIELHLDNSKK